MPEGTTEIGAMNLYTLVLDFHGGTYISQFDALSAVDAVTAWRRELQEEQLLGEASSDVAEGILVDAVENRLVEVEGLHGAWCAAATVAGNLALLNVIITQRLD
jgi:hypothetical protein